MIYRILLGIIIIYFNLWGVQKMFRGMRREKQLMHSKDAIEVLESSTSGVLSLLGDEGYPYGVPLSYVYSDSKIYFHSARCGHKIDAVKHCSKASFCVIAQDEVVAEKYTTNYRSIIAFGNITVVEDDEEKMEALKKLAIRYAPNDNVGRGKEIKSAYDIVTVLVFHIEHITGKAGKYIIK